MKKIKATTLYKVVILTVGILSIFIMGYNIGKYSTMKNFDEYVDYAETLIDYSVRNDSTFEDVMIETDIYQEYEEARDNILK